MVSGCHIGQYRYRPFPLTQKILSDSTAQTTAYGPNLAHCLLFLNKVLLEHSHVYSSVYCLWLLLQKVLLDSAALKQGSENYCNREEPLYSITS